jgi:S1-C subfamily serine protease
MPVLSDLSHDLAAVIEAAGRGVARVEARRRIPASGIVWADGVVVTANHVVQREENITVGLPDGRKAGATLAGRDPATDVAVLRVEGGAGFAVARTGADDLREGHLVLAIGRPGRTVRATLGIVSALGESWRTPNGSEVDRYLQTDAPFHPGFSGGPLVDGAGRVLGLNTTALVRGFSLTIPTATLQRVVETLLAHGRVRRGYLGIGAQPVRLTGDLERALGQRVGLLLISVESGSPAERGGLFVGDILVGFDGQPVADLEDLMGLLGTDRIGKSVPVRIVRGGQARDLTIDVGER